MPVSPRYWQTKRRPPILWRSATRERERRLAELSGDECSATPRLCCTISLRALERCCFSLTSPQRYTSCSESDSVTPDASFTTNEDTTTPYEVMDDDLLPEKSHNRDKALAHIKHLQHELSLLTTIMYTKHKRSNQSTTIDKERTNAPRPGVATQLLLLGHQYIANGNDRHNQQ